MRQHTSYPKPFTAQVVQEYLSPDVSIVSVALRHGINANLVHRNGCAFAVHYNMADQGQYINLFKSISIAGGLLRIAAFGGGAI